MEKVVARRSPGASGRRKQAPLINRRESRSFECTWQNPTPRRADLHPAMLRARAAPEVRSPTSDVSQIATDRWRSSAAGSGCESARLHGLWSELQHADVGRSSYLLGQQIKTHGIVARAKGYIGIGIVRQPVAQATLCRWR